jgi:hypothetical protein
MSAREEEQLALARDQLAVAQDELLAAREEIEMLEMCLQMKAEPDEPPPRRNVVGFARG